MPQFFLPPNSVVDGRFELRGPEAFHVVKVLRRREGDSIALFDGRGAQYEGVISGIGRDGAVSGTLTLRREAEARSTLDLRLYQGLLKASHWELVLEKATELGVCAIAPTLTPRTVVLLHEAERARAKQERWGRIVMAAAKQCGRSELPRLEAPTEFRDAIRGCRGQGVTLLAWEGLSGAPVGQTLGPALRHCRQSLKGALRVNLFVGPEGGFSKEEVELAESLGAVLFGLGPRVLRAETAALAACVLIEYKAGSL